MQKSKLQLKIKKLLEIRNLKSEIIRKAEPGFTLVELLLYMGIFSILLIVLLQLFTMILSTHAESQATSSVDQDGSFILSRLAYDIHKSLTVANPTLGNNCKWPDLSSCHLTVDTKTYQLDADGNLHLIIGVSDEHLNSINTEIESITFTTLGNPPTAQLPNPKTSVEIQFTLKSKMLQAGARADKKTFQTTVQTR